MKTKLNKRLFGSYCAINNNISTAECSEVMSICDDTNKIVADKEPYNCNTLFKSWCKADTSRIGNTYNENVDLSTNAQCRGLLSAGDLDETITTFCDNNDWINSKLCTDIRKNKGSASMKTKLNKRLFGSYCNTDVNISKAECADVMEICNDTNQLVSDKEPNNCNTLVKGLSNDTNIIAITNKLDLRNLPVGTNKSSLLNSFNEASTDAVETALCTSVNNVLDSTCIATINNPTKFVNRTEPDAFAKFLPIAIKYCGTGNNILTSECTQYYNNNIKNSNAFINSNYAIDNKAAFSNKETFENEETVKNEYIYTYLIIAFICFVLVLTGVNNFMILKYKPTDYYYNSRRIDHDNQF
jgi:hypothetical protein